MAEIRAFRAYRYDLGRVGTLGDVVAPPYDVIDPALQEALYARSPYNVVRLILNKEEPTDTQSNNRYTRAAGCLRDWQQVDGDVPNHESFCSHHVSVAGAKDLLGGPNRGGAISESTNGLRTTNAVNFGGTHAAGGKE